MQIFTAGANRTSDVKIEGFDIEQALGHEQDTCSFVVKSGDKPIEGQEIIIESNGVRLFGGIITNPKEDEKTPTKVFYSCEAVDYGYLFDKRLVVEVYENMPADEIALDIISKYCPDFTGNGIVSGAPTVEYIKFDYLRSSECFRQLAEYVGWKWKIDYYKDVKFFEQYNAFAPIVINENAPIRKLKHDPNIQGLRNRVYVLGGKMLSDPIDHPYVSDGVQRLWTLGHEPHSPRVCVGDASAPEITPGLEYVDDESSYSWIYNQREKFIRLATSEPTPIAGTTLIFRYREPMEVITMVEDLASQQAIAAIQGGDGIYEHKIVDDSLITIDAAEATGQAALTDHANPIIKGSFETELINTVRNVDTIQDWQVNQEVDDYVSYYFYAGDRFGQSLIATQSMDQAMKIQVGIMSGGRSYLPIETIWDICKDSNGEPGQSITDLSAVVAAENWPDVSGEWVNADITLKTPLRTGEKYWVVVYGNGTYSDSRYVKYKTGYEAYEDGYMVRNAVEGGWDKYLSADVTFRIKALILREAATWYPGQLLTINLPERGIQGQYLIQGVSISALSSGKLTGKITYGGRLKGIPDLLRALVSSQQQKKIADVRYQQKFEVGDDKVAILDEAIIEPRTTPWYAGDPDAIAGEIVALGVT